MHYFSSTVSLSPFFSRCMILKYRRSRNRIFPIKVNDQATLLFDWDFCLSVAVVEQLTVRQSILEQMLIDTTHIDRLRVNFVAHFNTDNDVILASNEINAMIDSYPREMTSELRQWLGDQQTSRLTAPLATVDTSKSIDDFQDYLNTIEENLRQFEQNQNNEGKFQVSWARLMVDSPFVRSETSATDRRTTGLALEFDARRSTTRRTPSSSTGSRSETDRSVEREILIEHRNRSCHRSCRSIDYSLERRGRTSPSQCYPTDVWLWTTYSWLSGRIAFQCKQKNLQLKIRLVIKQHCHHWSD